LIVAQQNEVDQSRSRRMAYQGTEFGYSAGVAGQGFSSKISDELTLFACNSGL